MRKIYETRVNVLETMKAMLPNETVEFHTPTEKVSNRGLYVMRDYYSENIDPNQKWKIWKRKDVVFLKKLPQKRQW